LLEGLEHNFGFVRIIFNGLKHLSDEDTEKKLKNFKQLISLAIQNGLFESPLPYSVFIYKPPM